MRRQHSPLHGPERPFGWAGFRCLAGAGTGANADRPVALGSTRRDGTNRDEADPTRHLLHTGHRRGLVIWLDLRPPGGRSDQCDRHRSGGRAHDDDDWRPASHHLGSHHQRAECGDGQRRTAAVHLRDPWASEHGGVDVTITSSQPSRVLVSRDASTVGTASATVTVPNGRTFVAYYVHGLEAVAGSANVTVSAPNFAGGAHAADVVPIGIESLT